MAGERCSDLFWDLVQGNKSRKDGIVCREGLKRGDSYRDWVEVEDDKVIRGVWRCPIATYDKKTDTMILNNCGYQTWLSKNRLDFVVSDIDLQIYQKDFVWYIKNYRDKLDIRENEELGFPYEIEQIEKRLRYAKEGKRMPMKYDAMKRLV